MSKWHQDKHLKAKESLLKLVNQNGHKLLSEYKRNTNEILIDFNCKHDPHWISPNKYKQGRECPLCSESKGEVIIYEWLKRQGIECKRQYIFDGLRDRKYDFFIPSIGLVIEVHGIQHYEECYYSLKGRTLIEEQENDRVKREFVEFLKYDYIEVDYRESKPQLALKRFIEQYNKIRNEVAS